MGALALSFLLPEPTVPTVTVEEVLTDDTNAKQLITEIRRTCSHTWAHEKPPYRTINGQRYTNRYWFTLICTTCYAMESRACTDECIACGAKPVVSVEGSSNHVADQLNEAMRIDGYTGRHEFSGITCQDCGTSVVWMEWDR